MTQQVGGPYHCSICGAWNDGSGIGCSNWANHSKFKKQPTPTKAQLAAALDAAWSTIEQQFSIQPRAVYESEAERLGQPEMGLRYALHAIAERLNRGEK